jgi:hypothetical protein
MMTQVDVARVEQAVEKILPYQIFDLYYGEPASGKSDAIYFVIKQALRENPGKKVKLVIGDGSTSTYAPLIMAGVAEVCEVISRPWPLDTMNKLTSGWWLKDTKDPLSVLIPPATKANEPNQLTDYCITVFEGFSVFGKYMMGSVKGGMAYRVANGEQIGPDPVMAIKEQELKADGKTFDGPGTAFGTNGTAHYMAAQSHLVEFAQRSRALPGHKLWTAHETIMDDAVNIGDLKNPVKIKKQVVIGGPEAAGKALTPNLQRIFNNTLHFQTIGKTVKDSEKDEATGQQFIDHELFFRMWTRDHHAQTGATAVKYKACTRGVGDTFPPYFDGKRGEGIMQYYRSIAAEQAREIASL